MVRFLLTDPAAPGLIPENVSEEKFVNVAAVNQWHHFLLRQILAKFCFNV